MGGCAGCVGPNRRDKAYKVNRLTVDSPLKSSITPSELPVRRHKDRVLNEISESKKQLNHNNLIDTLLSSSTLYLNSANPSKVQNIKLSATAYTPREPHESLARGTFDFGLNHSTIKREPRFADENPRKSDLKGVFEMNYSESKYLRGETPLVSDLKSSSQSLRESKMEPLSQVFGNKNREFHQNMKSQKLLNIPELPDEEVKTPHYVSKLRRENGEDVLRTGLEDVPRKIESMPSANLFRYLQDLQDLQG